MPVLSKIAKEKEGKGNKGRTKLHKIRKPYQSTIPWIPKAPGSWRYSIRWIYIGASKDMTPMIVDIGDDPDIEDDTNDDLGPESLAENESNKNRIFS